MTTELRNSESISGPGAVALMDSSSQATSASAVHTERAYDAYVEYHRLKEAGTAPSVDEYCAQFPSVKEELNNILLLDQNLEDNPQLLDDVIAWPTPGATFGRFRVLRKIGEGSFSQVYLATDPALGNRPVVLKVSTMNSPEAQLLGPISHPNVVGVHSAHEDANAGLVAVCMPYVGTGTLRAVMKSTRSKARLPTHAREILDAIQANAHADDPPALSPDPAAIFHHGTYIDGICHIVAQLADGLAHIHARGICHRDLKPANILMRRDGVPVLLDFNLSTDAQVDLAQIAGTIPYMAPEVLRGLQAYPNQPSAKPDKRADLYALGVILYELTTGVHPFGDEFPESPITEQCAMLLKRQTKPAMDVHRLNPEVDRGLSLLIQKCLSANPADRPANAADVAKALRARFSWRHRAWMATTRRPGLAAAVLFVTLSIAVAVGGSMANQPAAKDRHFNDGITLCKKGDFANAIKQFDEAIANGFQGPRPFIVRAAAHQRLGEKDPAYFQNALADLREADGRAPAGNTKAGMAYCLIRLQQYYSSVELSEDALKLGYDNAETHANFGYGLLRLGKSEEAKVQLDFALQKKPNLRPALHARAAVGYNLTLTAIGKINPQAKNTPAERELRHAIACMEKAQKLGDNSPDASFILARLHAIATRIDPNEKAAMLRHLRAAMEAGARETSPQDIMFTQFQNEKEFADIAKIRSQRAYASPICYADPLGEVFGQ